jgi:hypothetical protein
MYFGYVVHKEFSYLMDGIFANIIKSKANVYAKNYIIRLKVGKIEI